MEEKYFFAPQVDLYIDRFHMDWDGIVLKDSTLLDQLFELVKLTKPVTDDGEVWELWLTAPRGPVEAWGNYEEEHEWGDYDTYEEFEQSWKDWYPEEEKWYLLWAVERENGYRAIILNRTTVLTYDPEPFQEKVSWEDPSPLIQWLNKATLESIQKLQNGTYKETLETSLPYHHRKGLIQRKSFWDIDEVYKENDLEWLTEKEIEEFLALLEEFENPNLEHAPNLTVNNFFEACAAGYRACHFNVTGMTLKEMYKRFADGRDEGLLEVEENSVSAFYEWLHDRTHGGGHPWEVVAGGNSTHVDLFVSDWNAPMHFSLAGDRRVPEVVSFALAIHAMGYPVEVRHAKTIGDFLQGKDKIGVVPSTVFPRYCHEMFPDETLLEFAHLPYEDTERFIPLISWYPLKVTELLF